MGTLSNPIPATITNMAYTVSGSLNTPTIPFGGNQSNKQQNNSDTTTTTVYNPLTKEDVVSAIKEAQPDGDVVFKINEFEFGRIARNSLNSLARSSGKMGLKT